MIALIWQFFLGLKFYCPWINLWSIKNQDLLLKPPWIWDFLIYALRALILKMQIQLLWEKWMEQLLLLKFRMTNAGIVWKVEWTEYFLCLFFWKWKVEMTPRQNFFDWCCFKIIKRIGIAGRATERQTTLYIFTTPAVRKLN